jgi:hypothetical protein
MNQVASHLIYQPQQCRHFMLVPLFHWHTITKLSFFRPARIESAPLRINGDAQAQLLSQVQCGRLDPFVWLLTFYSS